MTRPQNQPTYTTEEMIEALREVDQRNPYKRMSQDVYERERDDEHPSGDAITNRLGSWTNIREGYL